MNKNIKEKDKNNSKNKMDKKTKQRKQISIKNE